MLLIIIWTIIFMLFTLNLRFLISTFLYIKNRRKKISFPELDDYCPKVLVQLPIYNESLVLRRILTAVTCFDYPKERLDIQVIDDSSPHEAELCENIVKDFVEQGHDIQYLRRDSRSGFKGGACNYGQDRTDCELIAIFDSDYVPDRSFVRKLVPYFADEKTACVQSRHSYLNNDLNELTVIQSAATDVFFVFEFLTRQKTGKNSLFIGSNGIWRKKAIEELGMWRVPQFVSEDIDMSLRAIAKGWRIQYHHEPLSRGEVIPSYISYKNQQEKWSGGFMRAIRFNLRDILFGSGKFWAGLHLTSLISCYLQLILPLFLLPLIPTALLVEHGSLWHCNAAIVALGLMSLFSPFNFMSVYCQYALYDDPGKKSLKLMSGSKYALGISFVVLKSVWDTLVMKDQEFIKTPKMGEKLGTIKNSSRKWLYNNLFSVVGEFLYFVICAFTMIVCLEKRIFVAAFFMLLFSFGYFSCFMKSMKELARLKKEMDNREVDSEASFENRHPDVG